MKGIWKIMSHKSLFERMEREIDLTNEYLKLDTAICKETNGYASINYVFEQNFRSWKFRSNYMSLEELRIELGLYLSKYHPDYRTKNKLSAIDFFTYCELIANLGNSFIESLKANNLKGKAEEVITTLRLDLEMMNHHFKKLDDGRIIVVETNPAATAVSEIVEPDLSDKIIEYNHYLLRGDLAKKREILRALSHKYDAIKPTLKGINSGLEDKSSFLLNNLNIRHNNKDKQSKDYRKFIADMSDADLEHWYDETYQTLLFAILAVDQVARNQAIDELKVKISEIK